MNQTFIQTASNQVKEVDGYEIGQRFEQYIIKLFNEQFFYLKKWRKSEKFTDSIPFYRPLESGSLKWNWFLQV